MKSLALVLALALSALASGAVLAQQAINVRGTVAAFDGKVISVNARGGNLVQVELPETVNVSGTKAITLADIKAGMTVAATTIQRADGQTVAIDLRPIPATAPIGLSPFDLQPGSTMTNALLEGQIESTGGAELTLNYKTGTVKVLVPPGTPMSQSIPGSRADIKPGETIFIAARAGADGKLTAARVQVSTNGVKPTQ
jgi:hypothetical protein